jgi:hypothetical protein
MAAGILVIVAPTFFMDGGSWALGFGGGMSAMFTALALATQHSATCWAVFGRAPQNSYRQRLQRLAPMMIWICMGAFALWGLALSLRTPAAPDDWPVSVVVLLFAGVGSLLGLALALCSARRPDMEKLRRHWERRAPFTAQTST